MPLRRALKDQTVQYRNAKGETFNARVTGHQVAQPANSIFSLSTATSGGTLAAATYSYRVSVVVDGIESVPCTAKTQVTTGSTSTVTVDVTAGIAAYPTATAFKVYGRTGGSELLMATITPPTATFVDTGAATPSGAIPSATNNVSLRVMHSHGLPLTNIPPATTMKSTGAYFARY